MEIGARIDRIVIPLSNASLGSANVYVLAVETDDLTLVDGGIDTDAAWRALQVGLKARGRDVREIRRVLITHGHRDHFGLAVRLQQLGPCEAWAHPADVDFMKMRYGPTYPSRLEGLLVGYGVERGEAAAVAGQIKRLESSVQLPDVQALTDGERIVVGEHLVDVIWTPGHTPGHLSLYDVSSRSMLTGDHILDALAPNVSMQVDSIRSPIPAYLASLDRIRTYDTARLLPGHGPATTARRVDAIRRHQLDRQAVLRSLLTERPKTPAELSRSIWREPPETPLRSRNEIGTVAAHLEALAEMGVASRVDQDGVAAFARA